MTLLGMEKHKFSHLSYLRSCKHLF